MRLTPRHAALALVAAALATTTMTASTAHADGSVYCFTVPRIIVGHQSYSNEKDLCVPWPFSVKPGS